MSKHILPMPEKVEWNQQMVPACVGFACAMAQMVKLYGLTNKWIPLSPYSIYGYYNNSGNGLTLHYGLDALRDFGALPSYEWDEHCDNPECAQRLKKYRQAHPEAEISAARFKLRTYRAVRGFDEICAEIDAGNPMVLSLDVDMTFGKRPDGIEPIRPIGSAYSHAVCIVGYTDDGYMIAKNSHRDTLGNGGIVYIPGKRRVSQAYSLCDVGTTITKKAKRIELIVGNRTAVVDERFAELDAAPYIKNGRTFLPVRFVAEALGASVGWDAATSTATLSSEEGIIKLTTHDKTITVNGKRIKMDVAPEIANGRMMLPIRPVAEALNCTVGWIENENKAVITAI